MEKISRTVAVAPVAAADPMLIAASAVIATRNRADALLRTLRSLAAQTAHPAEVIVSDSSDDDSTEKLCARGIPGLTSGLRYLHARSQGAASQRNEGVALARSNVIWFMDDDILFEPDCVLRLWNALESDPKLGGVNAMITNQRYLPPGRASSMLFRFLNGHREHTYAGLCIGPGLNLLPEDRDDLPEVVPVEWLNTTCVMYRRKAMPNPPFPSHFKGYSMYEDVTLSQTVGRQWLLANARTARILHDSQPGGHKADRAQLARMETLNRYYVMRRVRRRGSVGDHFKLAVWELFGLAAVARLHPRTLWSVIRGKLAAMWDIALGRSRQS